MAVVAKDVVTRVNPLQTAIASGGGLDDSPCLSMSRREQVILGVRLVLGLLELLA